MDKKLYQVPSQYLSHTLINEKEYKIKYQQSIENPEDFWAEQANQFISWFKPWQTVKTGNFNNLELNWFINGKLNASFNCLDRHLEKRGNQIAIIWEGDNPNETKKITYKELYELVCRFANVLKKQGVKKGDRVCIYLPMIPEAAVSMLACARIGAIHTVVFAGFSPESLKVRIIDCACQYVITADESVRGGKNIPLKQFVDEALKSCPDVSKVIVVKRTHANIHWHANRDVWYHEEMEGSNIDCPPEEMDSDDPLFVLYTSGSTGKPKGILHITGGYLVYTATTFKYIFDYQGKEIYWCTADIGWITGHSYLIYGPLCNGATTLIFEGVPQYPSFSRYWEIIDKHRVNIFYTSPTAIRSLRKEGEEWLESTNRESLRLLGTVGEPINPEVWEWYHQTVGHRHCPIVDTWWQTETGGILISPLPGATPLKPGSASWPFFGILPGIMDENGQSLKPGKSGKLIIRQPWPGMMKTIYNDHKRFVDSYFKEIPGVYLTGDSSYCDQDGYYWVSGRNDDVIKVSGHRIGTEEVESALLTHQAVSEAAVVAIPNEIKGQGIYAFVTPKANVTPNEVLTNELVQNVRQKIGPIATPEKIQWAQNLPKTRSGKIMRRLLRKIANNEFTDFGDISTLADPNVVESLVKERKLLSSP